MKNPTTDNDDDWMTAAMTDDSLVADLLLQMKHSPFRRKSLSDLAPATWGTKQPRSVPASASASASKESRRKSAEWISRRRSSPSTPLSWSGGSGAVDGSSLPSNQSPSYRSKISLAGTQVNGASSSKPRKKKSYAELKVEEDKLLMEKVQLHQKIAMLVAIVKEHREENESLRCKLNSKTRSTINNVCTAAGTGGSKVASSKEASIKREQHDRDSLASIPPGSTPASRPCEAESDSIPGKKKQNLMLPDLNMMPSEQEFTNASNTLRSMQSKPHTNK